MDRVRTIAAASLLLAAVSFGQNPPQVYRVPDSIRQSLDVRAASVQTLYLPPTPQTQDPRAREPVTVQLTFGGANHIAQLRPHDVRSPDFVLLVDDGVQLREAPSTPTITYRGDLVGEPGSSVAATIVDGQLRGQLLSGGKTWAVQPASDAGPGLPATAHVIYERSEVEELPFACATLGAPAPTLKASTPGVAAASSLKIARLAIDADEPFYRDHNRSVTSVQNDVMGIINAANLIYTRDLGIEHQISTIIVRTQQVYTTNDPTQLLQQFRERWNSSHVSLDRDVAHLFSGRNAPGSTIGIAYLDTICNRPWAYGVSWTTFSSNQSLRVGVTAHELGHGWGAGHCSGNDCRIMCSGIGGCSGDIAAFGNDSINTIESFKSSLSCLEEPEPTSPPDIDTVSPSTVTAYQPEEVTLTGSEFSQATSVTVGGLPASFTIVASDTLRFTPPNGMDIDTVQVSVSNAAGAGTTDLTVVGNHPSVLEIPSFAFRNVSEPYRVHTDAGWGVVLLVSPSDLPSSMPGIVDLAIGNDFAFIINFPLTADSRGIAEIELMFPPTIPAFTATHWQAVAFDPGNILFPLEVSEMVSMFVF